MTPPRTVGRTFPELLWSGTVLAAGTAVLIASFSFGQPPSTLAKLVPAITPARTGDDSNNRAATPLLWRLNSPAPFIIPDSRANPAAVADKFAARVHAIDGRAALRAFEGAPPTIPHPIADLNIQTCRACHAMGMHAGDKTARMVSHTYLTNCTQCHVESALPLPEGSTSPRNTFLGLRPSGYGGTRAWAGAPPVMPHSTFMRTNCISCHGEYGYDGWRPDHLSRTNCLQCHAPAAEFTQLAPTFGMPDVPDGLPTPMKR